MRLFSVVLFDVDGVITDTEELHFAVYREILAPYGVDNLTHAQYRACFNGKPLRDGLRLFSAQGGLPGREITESLVADLGAARIGATLRQFRTDLRFYADTLSFIRATRGGCAIPGVGFVEPGAACVAVTGLEYPLMHEILERHDLRAYFTANVTASDYSHGKPDPEPYYVALQRAGLPPERAMGVEDTPGGIKALKAAGVFAVGLATTRIAEELAEADMVVDTLRVFIPEPDV